MGVRNIVRRIGSAAGNKVSDLSQLSSNEVAQVQLQREKYLLEAPDPTDLIAVERTYRLMAASSVEIYNAYLPQIKELYLPVDNKAEYGDTSFSDDHNIRYINITKWVTDTKENSLEKLVNVYAVLSNEDCNIALVFNRTVEGTNVYIGVVNLKNEDNNTNVLDLKSRLIGAIRGNFPGAQWKYGEDSEGIGIIPCLENLEHTSVAIYKGFGIYNCTACYTDQGCRRKKDKAWRVLYRPGSLRLLANGLSL